MDIFEACKAVNSYLEIHQDADARELLIKLLDYHERHNIKYSSLVNHLIRRCGLYPYLDPDTSSWDERFIHDAFKVDVGTCHPVTLHREQSSLLKNLIEGRNLAISAPTSFGKSFIIDAFISIKNPKNVVIIVPTIALTDETRRRLQKKFSSRYKIITTPDVVLGENNILIFPQERAIHYADRIDNVDLLVIDEFYKASPDYDKDRSPSLLRAMLKLGDKSRQRYFLAPNISDLGDSIFTKGMEFLELNFNTVFLEKHDLYKDIAGNESKKSKTLINILKQSRSKTLVYAGTYSNVNNVANLIIDQLPVIDSGLLSSFEDWLSRNYERNWQLPKLVKRGTGIHTGELHRSLSQIQIKLFEDSHGLNNIISTSSIIEGVNTSAENIIIWRNKNGRFNLNDFTYRNIIGRGGRMFKHFIGKIYILEPPPPPAAAQLNLPICDEIMVEIDQDSFANELTKEQIAKIILQKEEMVDIFGVETFSRLQKENLFHGSDFSLIKEIASETKHNSNMWNGLAYLNSPDVDSWDRNLYKILRLVPGGWDIEYNKFVNFIKVLSLNWTSTVPEMLEKLDDYDIDINIFFKLERNVTYKLSSLLHDVNLIQKTLVRDNNVDISPFINKVSHAFLPPVVYQLEEYGLPRMISKKLHNNNIINFNDIELTIHDAINKLNAIGINHIKKSVDGLCMFDKYILEYFFDGVQQ